MIEIDREEVYLKQLAFKEDDALPMPQNRKEAYLKFICDNNLFNGGAVAPSKDEKVKMYANSLTSKYLNEFADNSTLKVMGEKLVCFGLDGQAVTIAELNTLQGMTQNVKQVLDGLANAGMEFKGTTPTKSDLLTKVATSGHVYIVIADETNSDTTVTYIYNGTSWETLGQFGISVRDFATDPLDLSTEVKGILSQYNIDMVDIATETFVKAEIGKINNTGAHAHTNKPVLDALADNNGDLEYNGKPISGGNGHTHANQEVLDNLNQSGDMLTFNGKVVVNNNEYSFKTLPRRKAPSTKYISAEGGRLPWQI